LQAIRFFRERVEYEEAALVRLFRGEYERWARETRIWIPTVRGHVPYRGRAGE